MTSGSANTRTYFGTPHRGAAVSAAPDRDVSLWSREARFTLICFGGTAPYLFWLLGLFVGLLPPCEPLPVVVLERFPLGISVTAVIESGFITIITGLPSLSFARTRKDSG